MIQSLRINSTYSPQLYWCNDLQSPVWLTGTWYSQIEEIFATLTEALRTDTSGDCRTFSFSKKGSSAWRIFSRIRCSSTQAGNTLQFWGVSHWSPAWPFCSRPPKRSNAKKTLSRNRTYFEASNGTCTGNGSSRKQHQSAQGQQPFHQEHTKQKETAAKPTLLPLWKVESLRSWLPIQGRRVQGT